MQNTSILTARDHRELVFKLSEALEAVLSQDHQWIWNDQFIPNTVAMHKECVAYLGGWDAISALKAHR